MEGEAAMIGPAGFMAGPRAPLPPRWDPDGGVDPCEWDPEHDRPTLGEGDAHAQAEVVLGRGAWRLCASCASLPRFRRYKLRRPIERKVQP